MSDKALFSPLVEYERFNIGFWPGAKLMCNPEIYETKGTRKHKETYT